MYWLRSIVILLCAGCMPAVAFSTPIVQNSGFESATTPAMSNNSFAYTASFGPITNVPNWTFGASGSASYDGIMRGQALTDNNVAPPEGVQAAFIQGTGTFSQTVSGFDNATYTLNLQAIPRNGGLGPNPITVTVGGQSLTFGGLSTFAPANATAWQAVTSDPFTVTAGNYLVTFTGTIPFGASDKMTSIDNIQFNAVVPEPASIGLLALGAIGCLAVFRRRARG